MKEEKKHADQSENYQCDHLTNAGFLGNSTTGCYECIKCFKFIACFNHGHHRGQLVKMLRQFDVEKIPETDFIVVQEEVIVWKSDWYAGYDKSTFLIKGQSCFIITRRRFVL